MANTFTNTGATPNQSPLINKSPLVATSSPLSSALNKATAATPVAKVSAPSSGSIVDYLSSQGKATDYNSRAGLASQYGISGYSGTADQNTQLLNSLRGSSSPSTQTTSSPAINAGNWTPPTQTTTTAQTPATPTPATPPAPTYTQNPNLYGQITTGLANTSSQPSADYTNIQKLIQQNLEQQKNLQQSNAKANSILEGQGIDQALATGQQGIVNKLYATNQGALTNEYQGLASQLSAANTQQGLQQSGLNAAGQLAQPITGVAYGTQIYDPVTGQLKSSGSSFTAGQVAGEQALGQQYAQNASAGKQAMAVKNSIVDFLNTHPNINPASFTPINDITAVLSGKTSNPEYNQLGALITDYVNSLAPILGTGGDVTNLKLQMAEGMINGKMSPQSIIQQLNLVEEVANKKLAAQSTGSGTVNQNINTSAPEGTTTAGSLGSYKMVNGKWIFIK